MVRWSEILASHPSAQNAEEWGTRFPGWGSIEWAGVPVRNAGSLDFARDDRFLRGWHAGAAVRATLRIVGEIELLI